MASFTSKATGDWDTAGQTTWNEVGFPGSGDSVQIQSGHVVSIKGNEFSANVTVDNGGTLRYDGQADGTPATLGIDSGSSITNNGTVDATGTGSTGYVQIFGFIGTASISGTDIDWDSGYWRLTDIDYQIDMTIPAVSSTFVSTWNAGCTLDAVSVGANATFQIDVTTTLLAFSMTAAGTVNLNATTNVSSYNQTAGTTTPAAAGTAINCSGNWNVTGGTWTDERGDLTINGSANLSHTGVTERLDKITQSGAITTTLTGLTAAVTFVASATGTINGSYIIDTSGTSGIIFDHNGVTLGSGTEIRLRCFGNVTIDSGTYHHLSPFAGNSTRTLTLNGNVTCNGNLTVGGNTSTTTTMDCSTFNITSAAATRIGNQFGSNRHGILDTQNGTHDLGALTIGQNSGNTTLDCTAAPTVTIDSLTCLGATGTPTLDSTGASASITCSGDANLSAGTYTIGTSTFVMTGDGTTLTLGANSTDFYKLHIEGNVAHAGSAIEIESGDFQTAVGKTFTIAGTLTVKQGAIDNFSNGGIIAQSGNRTLAFTNSTNGTRTLGVNGAGNYGTISVNTVAFWGYANNAGITLQSDIENTVGEFYVRNTTVGKTTALTTAGYDVTCGSSSTGIGFRFVIAGDATLDATNGAGGNTTLTSSGDVDFSGGTYTRSTSKIVMSGTNNLTTDSSNNDEFTDLEINGDITTAFGVSTYLYGTLTVGGTAELIIDTGDILYLRSTAATNLTNNNTVSGGGTLSFFQWVGDADVTLTATPGSITCTVLFQCAAGAGDAKWTLGATLATGTCNILRGNTGDCVVDTANFDLVVGGTTSVPAGATLQSGADAGGASWGFSDDVTAAGTIQATVTTGTSTFDIDMTTGKSITSTGVVNFSGGSGREVRVLWTASNSANDFFVQNGGDLTFDYVTINYADRLKFDQTCVCNIDNMTMTNGNYGIDISTNNLTITQIINCTITVSSFAVFFSGVTVTYRDISFCTFNSTALESVRASGGVSEFLDCAFPQGVDVNGGGIILDGDDITGTSDDVRVWGIASLSDFTTAQTTSSVVTVHDDDGSTNHGQYTIDSDWSLLSCSSEDNSTLIMTGGILLTLGTADTTSQSNFITGGTIQIAESVNWGGAYVHDTIITGAGRMNGAFFGGGVAGTIQSRTLKSSQRLGPIGPNEI